MEPEIPRQSYILVDKTEPNEIAVGDVILFYSDDPTLAGNMNTHRVVEIIDGGKEFVTRGDNNLKNDDYTAKAHKVIAVYKMKLPLFTMIGRFIAEPLGLIITVCAVFTVIFLLYYPDMKKIKKAWEERLAAEKQKEFDRRVIAEVERLRSENQQDTKKDKNDT
jgi:signal peptidase